MNDSLTKTADKLEPLFKDLPELPKNGREWLVKAWPVLALIFGILQLLAAWGLWHAGHLVNSLVNYSNAISHAYGSGVVVNHLGIFYWLGLIMLVVDGIVFLLAYPGLKARSEAGWNLIFLSALLNLIYGLFTAFDSSYGGIGKFIMTIIGSAIGFYFIYQVRSYYLKKAPSKKKA